MAKKAAKATTIETTAKYGCGYPKLDPGTVISSPCYVVDREGRLWLADPTAGVMNRLVEGPPGSR